MQTHNLFDIFIEHLNSMNIEYLITGSVASMIYGEPRLTHDIDIVLTLNIKQIKKLHESFPESDFYCPPPEILRTESNRSQRGHFNLIHHATGYKADIYIAGKDPLLIWGLKNRRKTSFNGHDVFIAPPEYVIIKKLEFWDEGGSAKHISDIRAMLSLNLDLIDTDLIESKLKSLKQVEQLRDLLNTL